MSVRRKVGIAGFGVVGQRRGHFISLHPDLELAAVCDRTFQGEGILEDGVRYYSTPQRLLEEDLDVLFVCLTNDVAADVTIAGLRKGLHVFCEKPPGRDLEDIARVIREERLHPALKLKYGFNHRYHDSVRRALEIVRGGEMGQVLNMRGVYGKSRIISFKSDWRTRRAEAGGGILLDQGIHMVDMMRLFAGEFEDIHSFVSNSHWNHDVEDNAYALMRAASGAVAILHSSATQWRHRFHLDITLSRGAIILSGILSGSKSYGAETITIVNNGDNDGGDPEEQTLRFNKDNSWRDEIDDFARSIIEARPIVEGSSLEALKTMHLVYRIYCADPAWKSRWGLSDTLPDGMPGKREEASPCPQ